MNEKYDTSPNMKIKKDSQNLVTLWTFQPYDIYQQILKEKVYFPQATEPFLPDWDHGYQWLIPQMNNRIGPSQQSGSFPIWAWYQWGSEIRKCPYIRAKGHFETGTHAVRIKFQKPLAEILLSDFDLWHFPLAWKAYLPQNQLDENNFEEQLKQINLKNTHFHQLPKSIQQTIEKSWEHIFNLEYNNLDYSLPSQQKYIQATFWSLDVNEIIQVEEFIAA